MEGLFNIDWNHLTYSSFSSLMCCFLMVTTIWDNPRNTIKNAFNSLFDGLKNKMHEQHAQLTHLNPAKKMEHIEYMDGKYEEMACLLENDLLIFRSVSYSSKELLTPNTTRDKVGIMLLYK